MKKTKVLVFGDGQVVLQKSGKYPCVVCCNGISRNIILCSHCMLWVHKTCSAIIKRLVEDPNYICARCKSELCFLPVLTPDTSQPGYMARCTTPALTWLCSIVVKYGDQKNLSYGGSSTMTMPWSIESVALQIEMEHPQLHYYRNLASGTLHHSFTVSESDGMAMYNGPCPALNLSQTFRFP